MRIIPPGCLLLLLLAFGALFLFIWNMYPSR
jgi:hypothetical protein